MDPRIRIHPKMSWIRNTESYPAVDSIVADPDPGTGTFLNLIFKKLGFPTHLHRKTSISGVFVAGITPSVSPCSRPRGGHRRNRLLFVNLHTGLSATHTACCNVLIADFFPDLSHRALVGPVS
jgi:hypothetical protein